VKELSQVIQRPLITERGAAMREAHNQYYFAVVPAANKHEIRQAVEHFFGVKVVDVRTQNRPGKPKRLGRFAGERSAWKKAIVTLAADESIDLFDLT
jgi:large subunit ribosomal protein L23